MSESLIRNISDTARWLTPKAFANSSPGLLQPWDSSFLKDLPTLKEFAELLDVKTADELFSW